MPSKSSTDILFSDAPEPHVRKALGPKIDVKLERLILACAIGCIQKDIPMSDADILRMHLALSRLISFYRNSERMHDN